MKKESLAAILEHGQKKYYLKDLRNQLRNLSLIENKIIDARLNGLSFCQLEDNDLRVATDNIMLRGAAITGAPTPTTEGFAEILSDEISKMINDFDFGCFTLDEIILAIRINSISNLKLPSGVECDAISFSGNCFNVYFLSKVLSNYKVYRIFLDRKMQNHIDGY